MRELATPRPRPETYMPRPQSSALALPRAGPRVSQGGPERLLARGDVLPQQRHGLGGQVGAPHAARELGASRRVHDLRGSGREGSDQIGSDPSGVHPPRHGVLTICRGPNKKCSSSGEDGLAMLRRSRACERWVGEPCWGVWGSRARPDLRSPTPIPDAPRSPAG